MRMIRWSSVALIIALVIPLSPPAIAQVPANVLAFCLGQRPVADNQALRDFYDQSCPSILSSTVSGGQASSATAAQTAEVALATQQLGLQTTALAQQAAEIQNLKSMLPAAITVPAAKDVGLAPFAHLAKLRQVARINEATKAVALKIETATQGKNVLLVTTDQLSRLMNSMSPVILNKELENLRGLVDKVTAACPTPAGAPTGAPAYGFLKSVPGAAPLIAEALLGGSQRISTLFQTSLVGAAGADFAPTGESLLWQAIISGWSNKAHLWLATPPIGPENSVMVQITKLRDSMVSLATRAAQAPEKSPCRTEGNALLDVISKRLETLNAQQGTSPSPISTGIQRAALDQTVNPIDYLAVVSVEHSGGAFASIKESGFSSAVYVQNETVVVSYRVQTKDGVAVDAGIVESGGEPAYYDKRLMKVAKNK